MRLRDLQSIDDEPEYIHDNDDLRAYEIERRQPAKTTDYPGWIATVYFDEKKFPNDASIERIERHYAQKYPGRRVNLQSLERQDLNHFSIGKYPLAEANFKRRGFASDIDVGGFIPGGQSIDTTRVMYCKAAVHLQLAFASHFLDWSAACNEIKPRRSSIFQGLSGEQEKLLYRSSSVTGCFGLAASSGGRRNCCERAAGLIQW